MALSKEEMMIKERIRHLLTFKRETVADLADTETLRVRYRRQINGEASIPVTTLMLILERYHDISADWLLMGDSPMRKEEHAAPSIYNHNEVNDSTAGGSIFVGSSTIPYSVKALLDEKDKRIAELEKDKAQLQGILSIFTRQAEEQTPKKR